MCGEHVHDHSANAAVLHYCHLLFLPNEIKTFEQLDRPDSLLFWKIQCVSMFVCVCVRALVLVLYVFGVTTFNTVCLFSAPPADICPQ